MMETSSPHPSADHESQCANQLMQGAGAGSGAGAVGGAEDLLQAFPLHRACRDGDLPALAVILGDSVVSLCDAVAQDPLFGWTPAHWAAHNGKVDCLEMLMKAGMPCNISSQGPGLTLAHVAALEGQSLCLAWLCQHGVNMNAQDHMGETAAHKAVRCGSVECLHILREHGADFSIQSSIGVTVMELAVQAHQAQCVQYFSAGGDAGHHMTTACLNGASGGRRKRLSVDDGAEAEVTDDTGVAKRARVDSATSAPIHHVAVPATPGGHLTTPDHASQEPSLDSVDVPVHGEALNEEDAIDIDFVNVRDPEVAGSSEMLPSVDVLPKKIERKDHWKFQPFCI